MNASSDLGHASLSTLWWTKSWTSGLIPFDFAPAVVTESTASLISLPDL